MKQREVRLWIREHRLSFCGLVETKVKAVNKEKVLQNISRGWEAFCNHLSSPNGRIWVCWDPAFVSVSMIEENEQAIHCRVQEAGKAWSCFVSVIYGDNCQGKRESLWADLISCSSLFRGSPWLVLGYFNAIRNQNSRVGGSREWLSWMDSPDECINEAELDDLKFGGHFFTWSNRREEGPIMRKLDRVLANADWENRFSGSEATFFPLLQ